ncbi:odorant receptor 13a-like [Venturia canescens]|uniref:odorant receptor 13a-like n=1 Tax=Venturia canescens TaxID=32260 RepID=UPI001C9D0A20|nr:odorant receptor 13a-like [Venturia canescens]
MSIDEYVFFNRNILKIVGLYPINLLRYFACLLLIFLIVVPQMFQLYLKRNDLSVILETSSVSVTLLLAILKSFVWLSNNETTKLITFLLTDYWQIARSIDTNDCMLEHAKSGRNVTRGYSFLIVNALFIFFSFRPLGFVIQKIRGNYGESLDDAETSFPFPAAYPTFFYKSPFYEMTYVSQMLATSFCGLLILAMDTLVATALFHTCGHFEILHRNLLALDNYIDQPEYVEKNETDEITKCSGELSWTVEKRLNRIVSHHQVIIRFSDSVEKAFNLILFLQVFASSLLICLVGFQLSTTTANAYKLAEYFSYLLMAMFQMLLFCWPGDKIIYHSSTIGNAAFSVKWYDSSSYIKMGIFFIILRSQKPNCLTAGKFYKMCMTSFATILNTSLSYFMLLRSINVN